MLRQDEEAARLRWEEEEEAEEEEETGDDDDDESIQASKAEAVSAMLACLLVLTSRRSL